MAAPTSRDVVLWFSDVLFGDRWLTWDVTVDNSTLSFLIASALLVVFCVGVSAALMCYSFFDAIPDCVAYSHRGAKRAILMMAIAAAATVVAGVPLFLAIHYA